jgi:hypothetical protein
MLSHIRANKNRELVIVDVGAKFKSVQSLLYKALAPMTFCTDKEEFEKTVRKDYPNLPANANISDMINKGILNTSKCEDPEDDQFFSSLPTEIGGYGISNAIESKPYTVKDGGDLLIQHLTSKGQNGIRMIHHSNDHYMCVAVIIDSQMATYDVVVQDSLQAVHTIEGLFPGLTAAAQALGMGVTIAHRNVLRQTGRN